MGPVDAWHIGLLSWVPLMASGSIKSRPQRQPGFMHTGLPLKGRVLDAHAPMLNAYLARGIGMDKTKGCFVVCLACLATPTAILVVPSVSICKPPLFALDLSNSYKGFRTV